MIVVKDYNMILAQALIDKAVEVCGSPAELARRLGVDRAEVTKLHKGRRPLSPELAAEIADIAGADAREAAIAAIIERSQGTRKAMAMREILGKGLAVGGAGMLPTSYSADLNCSTESKSPTIEPLNPLYIVSILRWSAAQVRRGKSFARNFVMDDYAR